MRGLRLQLLVLCFFCVDSAVLHNKAYFCRDPDSGKLHAVNTTWASTSFCGNYTCVIRKRNSSEVEGTPIRELNVTNIDQKPDNKETESLEKKLEPALQEILHKNDVSDPNVQIDHEDIKKTKSESRNYDVFKKYSEEKPTPKPTTEGKENTNADEPSDGDRYLTEQEINSIAQLLHTVKKSDLDAIVDIYKIAQDIYNEIDNSKHKETDSELIEEAVSIINKEENNIRNRLKPASYWYDPLGNKGRMADRYVDMEEQNTQIMKTTAKPKQEGTTYFNGALSSNDFRKLPYYYPVTHFHRISSYTHSPQVKSHTRINKAELIPDKPNPVYPTSFSNYETQKLIQPSFLLPYPFTNIHQYNITNYPKNFYYTRNPFTLDYYNKYKYYQPYFKAFLPQKAVLLNPHLSNDIQDVEVQPVKVGNEKSLLSKLIQFKKVTPNWKTEPISIEVLKDIRANIDTSRLTKAFPLRKKVKLERVGKLINTDDLSAQVIRRRRFTVTSVPPGDIMTDVDEYNAVLEKVTCREQTEPGYFRIGNMSHPYPDCCPQLILNRR